MSSLVEKLSLMLVLYIPANQATNYWGPKYKMGIYGYRSQVYQPNQVYPVYNYFPVGGIPYENRRRNIKYNSKFYERNVKDNSNVYSYFADKVSGIPYEYQQKNIYANDNGEKVNEENVIPYENGRRNIKYNSKFYERNVKDNSNATAPPCKDLSLNCPLWQQRDYCTAIGSIGIMMHKLCRSSCGACKKHSVCVDKNALCPTWNRLNQCDGDHKTYMENNCPQSCKHCEEDNCQDKYNNCKVLATVGYCGAEKQWMSIYCRKTCNFCVSSPECGKSFLSCGKHNTSHSVTSRGWQGRIVGGDTTVHGEVPWQVLIDVINMNKQGQNMFCGGSILTQKWVITAAHCFYRGWTILRLSFGAVYNFQPLQVQRFKESIHKKNIISHPEYVHKSKNNDIAVVKLLRPLTYSKEIQPICLPSPEDSKDVQTGIITGWGTIAYKSMNSHILLKACLKVQDCDNFKKNFTITENMICAYEDKKDACQGDSGGPLVVRGSDNRFVLLGIVSKGKGCALKNMPGAYTKVSNYILWISKVTGEEND